MNTCYICDKPEATVLYGVPMCGNCRKNPESKIEFNETNVPKIKNQFRNLTELEVSLNDKLNSTPLFNEIENIYLNSEHVEAYVFGGFIRSVAFGTPIRDVDIICSWCKDGFYNWCHEHPANKERKKTLKEEKTAYGNKNVVNGKLTSVRFEYPFGENKFPVEIWHVNNQPYSGGETDRYRFLSFLFFNAEQVTYRPVNRHLYVSPGFDNLLKTGIIDLGNKDAKYYIECLPDSNHEKWKRIAKTIYFKKLGFGISDEVLDVIEGWSETPPNDLDKTNELQIIKYGEVLTTEENLSSLLE